MFAAKHVLKGSIKNQASFSSMVGQVRKSMFEILNRNDPQDPHYQVCQVPPTEPIQAG